MRGAASLDQEPVPPPAPQGQLLTHLYINFKGTTTTLYHTDSGGTIEVQRHSCLGPPGLCVLV